MLRALSRWKRSILVVSAVLAGGLFLSRHLVGPLSGDRESGTSPPPQSVPIEEAARHVGERLKVCGTVAEVAYAPEIDGAPTFINLGGTHPDQSFTALVWGTDRDRWSRPLKARYAGASICVVGEAELHDGTPQIVVSSPRQLRVR